MEVSALKSKSQIEAMKKVLNSRDKLLFTLGINMGLRISDLLKLKVSDVTEDITITEKKTNKRRTITLNDSAKKAICDYIKGLSPDQYLFKSRKGNEPIDRIQAYRILNDAAHKAGIKGNIGTHTLRKTFGYWSYKNGVDISLLQKVFNHSSPAITLSYIGITREDIADVYKGLNL